MIGQGITVIGRKGAFIAEVHDALVLGVHMLSQVVCPIGDMIAKLTFEFYLSVHNVHVLTKLSTERKLFSTLLALFSFSSMRGPDMSLEIFY